MAEHFGEPATNHVLLAGTPQSWAEHQGCSCSQLLGSACSAPTASLPFAAKRAETRAPCWLLGQQHRADAVVPASSPVCPAVAPARGSWSKVGVKHFLQHLVSSAIDVWVALLVKIVMRESFNLNSQTGTHAQKKNDLEKNPPNSFRLPCSVKWK